MSGITLSSAVRNNLLSLQSTATLLGQTQNRLSTGLEVNSALDDPTAFFTSSSLNSRASDLNRLLDSVGNSVQTVKAADDGITAITKLVENAQATARQALQKPAGSTTPTTLTGTTTISNDTAAVITGTVTLDGATTLDAYGFANGETVSIKVGSNAATTFTIDDATTKTVANLVTALTADANVTVALSGGKLVATAGNATDTLTYGGTGDVTGLGVTTTAQKPTNASVVALTDTLSIQVNSNTAETIDLSAIDTKAELDTALAAITGVTASVTSGKVTLVAADKKDSLTIAAGDGVGLANKTTAAPYSAERSTLETEFNNLRTQIDQLSADASFNGVNLLKGDDLSVIFNEDGSSSLSITGVTFTSTGLGITAAASDGFQSDTAINSALTELNSAVTTLRTQGGTFGSNLSVIEIRQDFSKNLINTLETGAANLTLADTNEEAANLLALQTRQSLSSKALSLASQADQQVLQLLR